MKEEVDGSEPVSMDTSVGNFKYVSKAKSSTLYPFTMGITLTAKIPE